jgi:hypothetical protein
MAELIPGQFGVRGNEKYPAGYTILIHGRGLVPVQILLSISCNGNNETNRLTKPAFLPHFVK